MAQSSLYSIFIHKWHIHPKVAPKSLQRRRAVRDFYGTGIVIWAGFGPVLATFEAEFFMFSWGKKLKKIVDSENIFGIE